MKSNYRQLDRALIDSVMMRDVDRVRELLSQGANVNAKDFEHQETPLILAVKFAEVHVIRLLLDADAKVDARDSWGRTALFYTPVSYAAFKMLLAAEADLHAQDAEGNTLLMYRVSQSASPAEVEELLRLGINPNLQNRDETTALELAEELGLVKVAALLRSTTDE